MNLLLDTEIAWDIIGLYVGGSIITLAILYQIIKSAVKAAIKESREK